MNFAFVGTSSIVFLLKQAMIAKTGTKKQITRTKLQEPKNKSQEPNKKNQITRTK
jgi:hypothetical protein